MTQDSELEKSLIQLDDQLGHLLEFLKSKEDEWLQSRFDNLSTLPGLLENQVRQLDGAISDLRSALQVSGHASVRRWQEAHRPPSDPSTELSGSLRAKIQQTRQVAYVQELLSSNLSAYVRGVTLLLKSGRDATYSDGKTDSERGLSLQVTG